MKKDNNNWKKFFMTLAVLLVLSGVGNAITTIRDGAVSEFFGIKVDDGLGTSGDVSVNFNDRGWFGYNNGIIYSMYGSGKEYRIYKENSNNTVYKITSDGIHNFYGNDEIINIYGENNISSSDSTQIKLFNIAEGNTQSPNRIAVDWVYGNDTLDGANDRILGIHTHSNGTLPKYVNFYSNLVNNSYESKAFQWSWGTDTDGYFYLPYLNRISLPESYTGFYQTETNNHGGIFSNDEKFTIDLDSNVNDGVGTERFLVTVNNQASSLINLTTANALSYLSFSGDRAKIMFNATSASLDLVPGAGKGLRLLPSGNNVQIGDGSSQKNITLTSPDGTEYSCGVANGGAFSCS